MRADLARRVAALEARRPSPEPPPDPEQRCRFTEAELAAMSDEELDAYCENYDPPPAVAAELAALRARVDAMSDDELDDFLRDEWTNPEQENRRGPARRR